MVIWGLIQEPPQGDGIQGGDEGGSERNNTPAITPQQARTAFARYCKKIDETKEELAWNFGCISASQNNEQEAVLVRELILSNNKRLYHGAQSAADRTAATADMAETSVRQRAAGTEGGRRGW